MLEFYRGETVPALRQFHTFIPHIAAPQFYRAV